MRILFCSLQQPTHCPPPRPPPTPFSPHQPSSVSWFGGFSEASSRSHVSTAAPVRLVRGSLGKELPATVRGNWGKGFGVPGEQLPFGCPTKACVSPPPSDPPKWSHPSASPGPPEIPTASPGWSPCQTGEFRCQNGRCVPAGSRGVICNGVNDCWDFSDEMHCGECSQGPVK